MCRAGDCLFLNSVSIPSVQVLGEELWVLQRRQGLAGVRPAPAGPWQRTVAEPHSGRPGKQEGPPEGKGLP